MVMRMLVPAMRIVVGKKMGVFMGVDLTPMDMFVAMHVGVRFGFAH